MRSATRKRIGKDSRRIHGMYLTPEYEALRALIQRCENPKHPGYGDYGGRGISVCAEWRRSFQAFFSHIGLRPSAKHSIDRIDNDGNYEPGNVRWAEGQVQHRNKRTNHWVEFGGRRMVVTDWAVECGVKTNTMVQRLQKFPLAVALTKGHIHNSGRFGAKP